MPKTEIKARLTLRGRPQDKGTFQEMNKKRNDMIRAGFPPRQLHVGYAIARGVFYCRNCQEMVKDPETDFYNGDEYWTCSCRHFNFIKK